MDPDRIQEIVDPNPPSHRARIAAGEVACDQYLSEDLKLPSWHHPTRRHHLAWARTLADQVRAEVVSHAVLAVPVWLSLTEDGGDAEVELVLLLLDTETDWQHACAISEADALWFAGTVRSFGRRMVVPSRSYAPDVPMVERFGEYGVILSELAWQVDAVTDGAPVSGLRPPQPLPGPWCAGADLAMDPALLPQGCADWLEARLEGLRSVPPPEPETA